MEKEKGEKINREIHEKVMKKCWHILPEYSDDGLVECSKCAVKIKRGYENPTYLDISSAFAVVTEMEKRGFIWRLEFISDIYYAFFQSQYINSEVCGADTLPKAICEAALLVFENGQ